MLQTYIPLKLLQLNILELKKGRLFAPLYFKSVSVQKGFQFHLLALSLEKKKISQNH